MFSYFPGSDSEFDIGLPHDTTVELLGKPQQLKQEKPDTAAAEQKVKVIEPNKDAKAMENVDGGDKDDNDESSEDEVMKLVLLSISLHSHMQD